MAEEATTDPAETQETETTATSTEEEQRVPYERFQSANKKAKEAADRAKALEKELGELRSQMEARESDGLPELDQAKKRAEQLEKRAAEAEQRAEETETRLQNQERERWVTAAASKQNFIDPDDASRFVDLSDIESKEDAERIVKRVAKDKKHLIREGDKPLPGQVLGNGRATSGAKPNPDEDEGRMLLDGLRRAIGQ
jgi:DNA repair exonuclease SbcCD ATPase subunit